MIITIANKIGGCGKTTIALNLAAIFAQHAKTLLIDADPHEGSMIFASKRPETAKKFQTIKNTSGTIEKTIKENEDHKNIIIDLGNSDTNTLRSAIHAADILLIPITGSPFDLESAEEIFKIHSELSATKNIKTLVVFNMLPSQPNQTSLKEISELLENYRSKYNFKLVNTKLTSRTAYKEALSQGLSVCEIEETKYKEAGSEINSLYNEIQHI